MYASQFNYVTDYEREHQKLLMNFLAGSADVIDSPNAFPFSGNVEDSELTSEEKDYLLERGYVFSGKDRESYILRELYEDELKTSVPTYVVRLDTFNVSKLRSSVIAPLITEMERKKGERPRSELVLYRESSLDEFPVIHELEQLVSNCTSLNLSTKLVTTLEDLSLFDHLFTNELITDINLICSLSEWGNLFTFPCNTEASLDRLIEREKRVTVDVRLTREDVQLLKPLMNYFIYKGWPFLENFRCRLEPKDNEACIFGYWYNADVALAGEILKVFDTYPQTEYYSLEKWIGISTVATLIWKGRLPRPSFHFCGASKGLKVFTVDGSNFPCLKMAKATNESFSKVKANLEEFRLRNSMILSDCRGCRYALSCGGGCSYKAFSENGGRVCCPPIKDLIEVSLKAYFAELAKSLEKSEFT